MLHSDRLKYIRLGSKQQKTNALAYYATEFITSVKRFVDEAERWKDVQTQIAVDANVVDDALRHRFVRRKCVFFRFSAPTGRN